jgi:hypothetical protein
VLLAAVLAAAVWSLRGDPATGARVPEDATSAATAGVTAPATLEGRGAAASRNAPRGPDANDMPAAVHGEQASGAARTSDAAPRWPQPASARRSARGARTRGPQTVEPAVAVELAFQALRLVGTDAQAERTWRRAIDDPRTPEGTRSDLIEDLNQEGFTDNSRPTKADLPLILARLELIERLLPVTTDASNRASFEEAYKDLLAMYVRLGGAPRTPAGR